MIRPSTGFDGSIKLYIDVGKTYMKQNSGPDQNITSHLVVNFLSTSEQSQHLDLKSYSGTQTERRQVFLLNYFNFLVNSKIYTRGLKWDRNLRLSSWFPWERLQPIVDLYTV